MVRPRGRPAPGEWEEIREEFKAKYLEEDLTLRAVMDYFAQRGFVATERQFKTKVKAWGYDRKKIKGATFHSMYAMMMYRKRLGLTSKFIVPTHDNHHYRVITSEMIVKEVNRDRTIFDWNNVGRAEEILNESDVRVISDHDHDGPLPRYMTSPDPLTLPQPYSVNSLPQLLPYPQDTSDVINTTPPDSNVSPRPDDTIISPVSDGGSSSSGPWPHTRPATLSSKAMARWPTQGMGSEASSDSMASDGGLSSSKEPLSVSAVYQFDPAVEMRSLFFEPPLSGHGSVGHQSPSTTTINRPYPNQTDEEKQLAIQWAAPYVYSALHRNSPQSESLLGQNFRQQAKTAFRSMLKRNNRYLYPYCHWMVTMLASNNEFVLLTQFLTECCDVIDEESKGFDLTHGSPLHLSLALWTDNRQNMESYRLRSLTSVNMVRMIWGEDSPNYLVTQYYHSWLLLEQSYHSEALPILRQSLVTSERVMGERHILTLNCLAILARALAETGGEHEAISILKEVSTRLEGSEQLLQAYRYRQVKRLAELQIETGDLDIAEENLRAVIGFQCDYFGLISDTTWMTIDVLATLLKSRGRLEEASQFLQESHTSFHVKFGQEWFKRYGVYPPWELNTSHPS